MTYIGTCGCRVAEPKTNKHKIKVKITERIAWKPNLYKYVYTLPLLGTLDLHDRDGDSLFIGMASNQGTCVFASGGGG